MTYKMCSDLNKKWFSRHVCLNVWSPVGNAFWEEGTFLLEQVCHWWRALGLLSASCLRIGK